MTRTVSRDPSRTSWPARRDEGMTLTELAVAVALLTVVVAAAYLLFEAATGMADFAEAQSRAAEETRSAMDRITREVRQAAELPGLEGTGVFSEFATGQVGFYADVDHEGLLERVRYRRAGARLMRSVTEPVIVDGDYTFGPAGPEETVVFGIPAEWADPVFVIWSKAETPVRLTSPDVALASAISVHIKNRVTVGRRTAVSDEETWIKVRSVHNAVN